MNKLPLLLLFILITGCTKEKITIYNAYVKNTTAHQIKVVPYFSGVIDNSKILLLNAGDSINIGNGFDRGIINHGGFNSVYISGSDSNIVIFDNTYSITHYGQTPSSFSIKYYLHTSPRNLRNYLNWYYTAEDPSKNRREAFYLFRFIEQDYLDAR
ncbi:MAG: hypothetical protein HOP10_11960 [Chitinophagaceae bacterium]|nr:hypothetical protein [Chitinophagaceae bacterium]